MKGKTIRAALLLLLKLVVALIVIAPFYVAIIYSVKSKPELVVNRLAWPRTIHWENFTNAIQVSNFSLAVKNSLITTVFTVIITTMICSMAAYMIARKNTKFYNFLYYMFLGAMIIPFQSIMTPLYVTMSRWKMLNTLWGYILVKIGFQVAFTILIVTGFVKNVPKDLEEAAAIDGSGLYSTYFRIVLPLMRPVIFTSVILNTLNVWNDFQMSLALLQKKNVRTIPLTQYYFFGENSIELGLAFALFLLSMIPILALYFALQKYIISGITSGSVKG